jgi:hypothetical protein
MVVLVCGGSSYDDYERFCEVMDDVEGQARALDGYFTVVTGNSAVGVDALATMWGKDHGTRVTEVDLGTPAACLAAIASYRPAQALIFGAEGSPLLNDLRLRLDDARINTQVFGS